MVPSELHKALDHGGHLADSKGPGVYALAVAVPDSVDSIQRARLSVADHPFPDGMAEQLAAAERVVYVGESGHVYDRLMDHARGEVRRASLLRAFAVTDVVGVWPGARTGVAERDRARALSDAETVSYANGELF